MPENAPTGRSIVEALLAMHGLSPSPEEVDQLVASYPVTRAVIETLYTMPGVRYEEPALIFDPRV